MIYLGDFPVNSTIYVPFNTFSSVGASVTITGLAVTDIEIYKDGSATQRASDAGYTLLDTDGIDFDGITGIHGFSIDLSDNTDAGFYAAGHEYWIVVASVTCDSQTVSFVAATFSIERTGGALALLKSATYGLSALKDILDTSGVVLGATQGSITWAQQKIVANVASQGALDITNSNALGIGTRNNAPAIGQYNLATGPGSAGQTNEGVAQGQHNDGATGQQNDGGAVGQYNTGTTYGQQNTGASGSVNVGTAGDGIYASGTDKGLEVSGVVSALSTDPVDQIADQVWDELIAGHLGAGSTGAALNSATAPSATAVADAVWDELIAGHAIAGSTGASLSTAASAGGATPASLWAYSSRTLTQSAAQVADIVSGSSITVQRGDSLSAALTGLGAITGYTTLDFTVKANKSDADTSAIIRIRKNTSGLSDGLIRLNGAAATTAADGSITINDAALGNITIALIATDTATLIPGQGYYYDVQKITGTTVLTMTTGTFNVSADVTRLIA